MNKFQNLLTLVYVCLILLSYGCSTNKKALKTYELYKQEYKLGFENDPRAPLKGNQLDSMDFFTYDESWNLKNCKCTIIEKPQPFEMATYSGITRTYITYATAICKFNSDQELKLAIYKNITQPMNPLYKDYLFLPYKDHTNGETTYGGGRYINLKSYDIKNGEISIDFNKSYNPWCAYSGGYNCPIPPKENHLGINVNAGEKLFLGKYKK